MTTGQPDAHVRALQERAKELACLYHVEEQLGDPTLPPAEVLGRVAAALPAGWQHPEHCVARITCDGASYPPGARLDERWVQRADICDQSRRIGTIEVGYTRELPAADEGPFLAEERRLVDTIAAKIGRWFTQRRLILAADRWEAERAAQRSDGEWRVIVDLLRRTDQDLLRRVARKLLNHLRLAGVEDAAQLLRRMLPEGQEQDDELSPETNIPQRKRGLLTDASLVEDVFAVASRRLGDAETVACIQQWIRADRAGFLVTTVDDPHATHAELSEALDRYTRLESDGVLLPQVTRKGVSVSLARRLLSSQVQYLRVAKDVFDLGDFRDLLLRTISPNEGYGKVGGKAAGLLLAQQVLRRHAAADADLAAIRTPRSWYVSSDGLRQFVYANQLEDVFAHKYRPIEEVRREYPDLVQLFLGSRFSVEIVKGLQVMLDELGDAPLIVRSSSLLEDRFGAAFSGKYKSLFVANQGDRRQRMAALLDAIAEVYASTFGPDPILYRAERGLLDFQEGMGVLIQEVVGRRIGPYFLPTLAGVAFSHNEFRWSPRLRREDGLVRLVPGLGTRAVDRVGDDFPVLAAPGQPGLRANTTIDERVRYAPRFLDVINLETQRFETVSGDEFLRTYGRELVGVEQVVSVLDGGVLRPPIPGHIRFDRDDLVFTFDGLLDRGPFVRQIRGLLDLLSRELHTPVDVEFASDGVDLYLLQCRAQNLGRQLAPAAIPRDLPPSRVVFSARRHISNGSVSNISHVVYVDPACYERVESHGELVAVGRAVARLNQLLPKRRFILIGPGRWGSRGDIRLGVKVTYSDICNTAMLVEVARRQGPYTPELSFGTHFFQDLVEAGIRYLPLYPDDDGAVFQEAFFGRAASVLAALAPELAALDPLVRVIDVPAACDGRLLHVLMNADLQEAVGLLAPADEGAAVAAGEVGQPSEASVEPQHQHWRWRRHMAERIAQRCDAQRFGVVAMYLFGSTEAASAGPGSDIDLLVHVRNTPEQQRDLERWLEGWSRCLSEMNFLRTGYETDGLLDAHFLTDEDLTRKTSFAARITAVTDAARPLPLGAARSPAAAPQ
jgi:pyruvate,water dikinase